MIKPTTDPKIELNGGSSTWIECSECGAGHIEGPCPERGDDCDCFECYVSLEDRYEDSCAICHSDGCLC